MICDACQGRKFVRCNNPRCYYGRLKLEDRWEFGPDCPTCSGEGEIPCLDCEGKGEIAPLQITDPVSISELKMEDGGYAR
jgi:RecJ-like exonuclease